MTEKMTMGNPLETQPINKLIWKFAIPGIISQLTNSVHNIVDQAFLGWVQHHTLAFFLGKNSQKKLRIIWGMPSH